jgi:diguanylate cyclase (GGDEF)-like protein
VLLFILTVATLNFALGLGIAIAVSHDLPDLLSAVRGVRGLRLPLLSRRTKTTESHEASSHAKETAANAVPDAHTEAPPSLELPEGWQERLTQYGVAPLSVLEAMLQLLRCDGEVYRSRCIAAEQSLWAAAGKDKITPAAFNPLRTELTTCLGWARGFLVGLKDMRTELGDAEPLADQAEELLLNQVAQVEALQAVLDSSSDSSDLEYAVRQVLRECARVFDKAHSLRDFALDQLAIEYAKTNRMATLPGAWQRDSAAACANRLGLENIIGDWVQADPTRKRLVSGAFIEIDRLGKLNERLGTQQTDQVIRAFAKLVEGVIRSDRGDRVARAAGPTIFVLLTDAGVAGAKAAAERIRQTVEAATFESQSEEFTLAANCAVCDFLVDDTTTDLLTRLRAGIAEAKRGGRNRTAIDEGQGPVLFDPQPVQVRAQVIRVGAA